MSSLEGVCDRSDALAKAVLQYLALRASERSFEAGRLRKTFRALADEALAESAAARGKRDKALSAWSPSGPIPLRPRPANDEQPSMPDSKA